jgi:hypothetical protein
MRLVLLLATILLALPAQAKPQSDLHHLRRLESVMVAVAIHGDRPSVDAGRIKTFVQRRLEKMGIEELMPSELEQNPTSPRYATFTITLAGECRAKACALGGDAGLTRPGLPADQVDRPGFTWPLPTWSRPLVVVVADPGEAQKALEQALEQVLERFAAAYFSLHPNKHVPDANLVKQIQEYLWLLGLEPGPRDGIAGNQTRQAIRAFQKVRGLAEDGRVSGSLLEQLRQAIQQRLKGGEDS